MARTVVTPQLGGQSIRFWLAIIYGAGVGGYVLWKIWRTITGQAGMAEWRDTDGPTDL